MTAEQLAADLAARLAAVVPGEVTVSVAGAAVVLRSASGVAEHDIAWRLAEHGPVSAVESVLDQLQDDVAEAVGEPWPAAASDPMPDAFARAEDGAIVAGYEPGLSLDPIPLA